MVRLPTKETPHPMCLPSKTDQPDSSGLGTRSILGMGALMLLACLAAPALVGAIGALGVGVLVGAGGAIAALALCAVVPMIAVALRRRSARRESTSSDIAGSRHGA
jgi:hypothetical protein